MEHPNTITEPRPLPPHRRTECMEKAEVFLGGFLFGYLYIHVFIYWMIYQPAVAALPKAQEIHQG